MLCIFVRNDRVFFRRRWDFRVEDVSFKVVGGGGFGFNGRWFVVGLDIVFLEVGVLSFFLFWVTFGKFRVGGVFGSVFDVF